MNSQPFTFRATCVLLSLICSLVFSAVSSAAVTTTYTGGDMDDTLNWDNGLPDGAADIGGISINQVLPDAAVWDLNSATIEHTAGNINYGGFNSNISDGTYNLSGGSLTNMGIVNVNNTDWNISGGSITAPAGKDIVVSNGASFNLLAGNGTINVGDQFRAGGGSGGTMNVQTGWTGSFTANNFSATDWEALFSVAGFTEPGFQTIFGTLDGSTLDSAEFNAAFTVSVNGQTLTPLSLPPTTSVPEPITLVLAAFGLLSLCMTRRRRSRS